MKTIDDIPLLLRREIEALIVVPILEGVSQEIGWEKSMRIANKVISKMSKESGKRMAAAAGGNSLDCLENAMCTFNSENALDTKTLYKTKSCLKIDVSRCEYASMYKRLGIEKYGLILSCNRDAYLFEGFNPNINFSRQGTILEGAHCCDFCMRLVINE